MAGSAFLTDRAPSCPQDLLDRARAARPQPLRLAVVRASAPLPMLTARQAHEAGIATPILIGEADLIKKQADAIGWDLSGIAIHDSSGEKGAIDHATAMTRKGGADAIMKGHLHSDVFMGGIVAREAGIRGEKRMVHIFAMFHPDGGSPILISDAAVNVTPDIKTRQQTVISLAETAKALGIDTPRIAIIAATETPIASIPSSMEAKELSDWAQDNVPGAVVNGPLSFDLAMAPEAVAIKGLATEGEEANLVAGRADALVMPEITSGNVLFKAMVWHSGACAAGVVTGGKVPIILTSRADPPEARLASIALAALC
ncbi:MAG: phosphate acetyltransferase [Alphaproteobacteria bacterium]|nr:phosphate acetyltransferase [Alphaproteobacteria bacterium]